MGSQIQIVGIVVVVIVSAVLLTRALQKSHREEREFFRNLIETIAARLVLKGYLPTALDVSPTGELRALACYESKSDTLELAWDERDRDVSLVRRLPEGANSRTEVVARARVPQGVTGSGYEEVAATLLQAVDTMRP